MQPLILAIETATLRGGICLGQGEKVLASAVGDASVSHSNTLLKEIDEVLKAADVSLNEIDVFAVATGPGSFTGLRIGIATVKGLAETLGRPCIGIPTLEAVAHSAGPSEISLAILPAGRGEVFAQAFSVSATGDVSALDEAVHLAPARLLERYALEPNLLLTGDAVNVNIEKIRTFTAERGYTLDEANPSTNGWRMALQHENLAVHVAALAHLRAVSGQYDRPNTLQAIYVRPSDAELKNPAGNPK